MKRLILEGHIMGNHGKCQLCERRILRGTVSVRITVFGTSEQTVHAHIVCVQTAVNAAYQIGRN